MKQVFLYTATAVGCVLPCPMAYARQGADTAIVLDAIVVEGEREPVPSPKNAMRLREAYAGGQVATGSQLGILGNRDAMNTPFNVTGYTAALIANTQAHSVADVVANDPSVRTIFPRASYRDVYSLRGFSLFSYNMGLDGLYGIAPKQRYPAEFAERIEVLKGPDTFINGISLGGNVGGAINIVPKRATDQPITTLTLDYAADSEFGTHLDFGRRYGADEAFGLRFNGIVRGGDLTVADQSERLGAMALNLDYEREGFRLYGNFGTQQQRNDAPDWAVTLAKGVGDIPVPSARTGLSQDWAFVKTRDSFGSVRAEYDVTDNWTLFGTFGASTTETTGIYVQPIDLKENGDFTASIASFPSNGVQYSGQSGLRGQFDTGAISHNVTFAYAGSAQNLKSIRTALKQGVPSNIDAPVFIPRPDGSFVVDLDDIHRTAENRFGSLVAADTLSVFDERFLLTLGARWQSIRSKNFDAYSGRQKSDYDRSASSPALGAVFKLTDSVSLYGNYAEALQQGTTAPSTAANYGVTFAPVVARQIEKGVKIDWGNWMTSLSLFQITQPTGITDPTTRIYDQDGEQRNRGLELNIAGEPFSGIRLLGGVALLDGTMTRTAGGRYNGNKAIGVPDYQINLGAEWDTPFAEGLTFSARMINTGKQFADVENTQRLDAWTRFDLGARYVWQRGQNKPVTFRLAVENLLDRSYWASASSGQISGLSRGAPRTILLSTSFTF